MHEIAKGWAEWCDAVSLHQNAFISVHFYFQHWLQQMMMLHQNLPPDFQIKSTRDMDRLRFPIALSRQHWTTLRHFGLQNYALSLLDSNDASVTNQRTLQRIREVWITSKLRSFAETRQRDRCIAPLFALIETFPNASPLSLIFSLDSDLKLFSSTKEYRLPNTRWKVDAHVLVQQGSFVIPFLFELKSAGDSGNVGKRIKEEQWRWTQIKKDYHEFVAQAWSSEGLGLTSVTLLSPIPCIVFGGCISVNQVNEFQSIGYSFFWEHEGAQPIASFIQQQCNALEQ